MTAHYESESEDEAQDRRELEKFGADSALTDREIALESLRLSRDTNEKITEAVNLIQSVSAEVDPVIQSITESPAMKMLGFGPKKFGK